MFQEIHTFQAISRLQSHRHSDLSKTAWLFIDQNREFRYNTPIWNPTRNCSVPGSRYACRMTSSPTAVPSLVNGNVRSPPLSVADVAQCAALKI